MGVDEDIRKLLEEWGLPIYIPTFEANNITLSTLAMLDNSLVKELITPIGDRAKFLKNLDNWKRITKPDEETNTPTYLIDVPDAGDYDFVDVLKPSHKNMSIGEFLSPTFASSIPENSSVLANSSEITDKNEDLSCSLVEITDNSEDISCSLPLKNLLMKSYEGQGRRKLCNIIIKDLIEKEPTKLIDSSLLLEKAQQIKDLFKKENISTFFIPYINDSKLKIKRCAKGKLYDCLQNRRRELREAKIIIKKTRCSSSNNKLDACDEPLEADGVAENCNDEDILWLQNCTEPWHSVEEKWRRTMVNRLNEIKAGVTTVDEYMNKYPVLKTPRGHELLIVDFDHKYPSSSDKLYENFPMIKQKLFNIALSKCQLTEVKEILEQLQLLKKDSENYEEIESILAFMLLPLLLGNPSHKAKKQVWRPSKAEVKDGFITHVRRPMDVQDTIAKRREKYLKYNLTFQPTIVIVGPNYSDIQKYYVVINDYFFETQSILKTVDACFKIYHSLHCQYPTESLCVWNFVQIGLYRLKTQWDKHYSTVNAFITDLEIEQD